MRAISIINPMESVFRSWVRVPPKIPLLWRDNYAQTVRLGLSRQKSRHFGGIGASVSRLPGIATEIVLTVAGKRFMNQSQTNPRGGEADIIATEVDTIKT